MKNFKPQLINGDFSYEINVGKIMNNCVKLTIIGFSGTYDFFDLKLSFKDSFQSDWKSNMHLYSVDKCIINDNKIFNLRSSINGVENTLYWNVPDYYNGKEFKIRSQIITRFLSFGYSGIHSTISESNENILHKKNNLDGKCVNYSNDLNMICLTENGVFIYDKINSIPQKSYTSLSNPKLAIQNANNFLIVDDNGITELDENFNFVKDFSENGLVYIDYSEDNKTILATSSLGYVKEYTWDAEIYGDELWESSVNLNTPLSATYKKEDCSVVLISDAYQNRIVEYNLHNNTFKNFVSYSLYKGEGNTTNLFNITTPLKAVAIGDKIHVFEQQANDTIFYDVNGAPTYPLGVGILGMTFMMV